MAESKEELKSLLMKVKKENEKAGLKLNIQKTKILATGPIISWKINGETMETVTDFVFLGSKITVDGERSHGDCSHEIKRRLLLGRKVTTNLDSILKSRDITLPTKVRLVKGSLLHTYLKPHHHCLFPGLGLSSASAHTKGVLQGSPPTPSALSTMRLLLRMLAPITHKDGCACHCTFSVALWIP